MTSSSSDESWNPCLEDVDTSDSLPLSDLELECRKLDVLLSPAPASDTRLEKAGMRRAQESLLQLEATVAKAESDSYLQQKWLEFQDGKSSLV